MPNAIGTAAAAFANWAYGTFFASAGYGTAAHAAIVGTLYYGGQIALSAAVSAGLNSLARAQINTPEAGKITRRQPRPERVFLVGDWTRVSGAYMLRETKANKLGVVLAQAEGPGEVRQIWLNDDRVTLIGGWVQQGPDKRYGAGDLIQIDTRNGVETETAYSQLFTDFGDLWTSAHRGDGIQSLMMLAQHRSKESFNEHFPNGEPIPSAERRAFCYDWRDPAQDRDDPTTWGPSANPVVWLVFIRWHRLGLKWDRCIAPVLDALTAEADYCDDLVDKIGGTEPRYTCSFSYGAAAEPQSYLDQLTATFDGWMTTDGRGRLVVKAGRYDEPTVTITADHILGYRGWRAFNYREDSVNVLKVSFVDPGKDYTEVECDPWRDEADIVAVGQEREQTLQLLGVGSLSQARRLAKRQMARLNAPRRGQILCDLHGLQAMGHRYIRVQNDELQSMADVVVEVMNIEIDPDAGQVVLDVILADPNVDEWNPATEEGNAISDVDRPEPEALAQPTITSVTPFSEESGSGAGIRLAILGDGPDRPDLTWFARWRVDGDASWAESQYTDTADGTPVQLETGFVPVAAALQVQIAYQTGGGALSPWSETYEVETEAEEIIIDGGGDA